MLFYIKRFLSECLFMLFRQKQHISHLIFLTVLMGQRGGQITPELLFESETHFTDNDLSISNNLQK